MVSPPLPRNAALHVLLNPWLLSHVTSFQAGLPLAVYEFWAQHDPRTAQDARATTPFAVADTVANLLTLVVAKGTVHQLELLVCTQYRNRWGSAPTFQGLSLVQCVNEAITHRRTDMVAWLFARGVHVQRSTVDDWWWRAFDSYRSRDVSVLALLKTHHGARDDEVIHRCRYQIAEQGDLALLQWVNESMPGTLAQTAAVLIAGVVRRGDIESLRYVHDHISSEAISLPALELAYEHQHFTILEFLVQHRAECLNEPGKGYRFQQRLADDPSPTTRALLNCYTQAFRLGHLYLLERAVLNEEFLQIDVWYKSGRLATIAPIPIDNLVVKWDPLRVIRLLNEKGLATATTDAMDKAAENGLWDVVDYLHANRTEGCTTRASDAAVKSGDLDRVRFFHEHYVHVGFSSRATAIAAEAQSIEMLRFLHTCPTAAVTTDGMDGAAANGRLHVVKFLHNHRTEGCTTAAIDGAAKGGHLEVVQFLLKHRTEGFTQGAIHGTLSNGHIQIVTLFYDRFPDWFGPDLLHDLLLRGAFDIYMTLRETYPSKATAVVEKVMLEAGKEMELPTIRFILDVLGRWDLAPRAVDGAAWLGNLVWLRALFTVTGADSCRLSAVQNALANSQKHRWRGNVFIPFIARACTDPRGLKVAITKAKANDEPWLEALEQRDALVLPPLHPLLLDPRTRSWAIQLIATNRLPEMLLPYGPFTWPIRAILQRDVSLLEVLRDLPLVSVKEYLETTTSDERWNTVVSPFSFRGARKVAVCVGDMTILDWLLTNVDLPTEPTLLGDAIYYHQYEIAEFLVVNYPLACTEFDWSNNGRDLASQDCGFHDGLFDWLTDHETVRQVVPFVGIIDYAARQNDVASLERLYEWHPELFTPRPTLIALADREECSDTVNFLLEIGWDPEVFFGDC